MKKVKELNLDKGVDNEKFKKLSEQYEKIENKDDHLFSQKIKYY